MIRMFAPLRVTTAVQIRSPIFPITATRDSALNGNLVRIEPKFVCFDKVDFSI